MHLKLKPLLDQFLLVGLLLAPLLGASQRNLFIPSDSIQIFASGIISTGMNERDMAISPDGREIFYTIVLANSTFTSLVCRKIENGKISKPTQLGFTGKYSDLEPAFSHDGKRLYFVSNRPLDQKSNILKDYDIWYVERVSNGWSEPKNLGAPINTEQDEFYPSLTKSGRLYFTAGYKSGKGGEDVFFSEYINGKFGEPLNVGDSINSPGDEFNAFVSPDEDFIIFSSVRKGDLGRGDLYISLKSKDKVWVKARNMGTLINSSRLDYCPYVSPDGKTLFITSERIAVPRQYKTSQTFAQIKEISFSPGNGSGDLYFVSVKSLLSKFVK